MSSRDDSAAFTFGDHLGFTAGFTHNGVGVGREMIFPMIAGKLTAGITAVIVAYLLFRRSFPPADASVTGADATAGAATVDGADGATARPEAQQ